MRKSILLLAGAAGLALATGAAHAQSYSWGDSTTTYFYSPSTSDSYSPSTRPPSLMPPAAMPPAMQIEPLPVPTQVDPSYYRAPDSYGFYRQTPIYEGALGYDRPYFYSDESANLGQGSGHSDMIGR